jgi:arginyl-tRNA synthetase
MADPQAILSQRVQQAMERALGQPGASADPAIRRSDFADYQANAALGLAKMLSRPPRQVAQAIVAELDVGEICERVEISGPGFINLTLRDQYLATLLNAELASGGQKASRPERAETVIIDYSGPNVAKEMHVGHLRSTILGDALTRALSWAGHWVIAQNHVGDWGTPFGMLIEHLVDLGEETVTQELSLGELNRFYREARSKFDSDSAFAERSRRRVVAMQAGDVATLDLWKLLVDKSKAYFTRVYRELGVRLTDQDICGESFYNPMLPEVAVELESSGVARLDEGALCVFLEGFSGREGEPVPLIVRKQDGGFGYAATDLAAIRYRIEVLGADRILYVIGSPQQQHLAMVFAAAKKAGWLPDSVRVEHVAFGSVLGSDKKMLKTRSGESVKLIDLLDEAIQRAEQIVSEKNPELDQATRSLVARQVGIGAVKYADLSSDRVKDYMFDWDRMLAFEGNTAPYLQYAHARIRSIFRRGGLEQPAEPEVTLTEPVERALALELLSFQTVVDSVCESSEPHHLCKYLYELATRFTAFYESCPVLKAKTEAIRQSRLALSGAVADRLRLGLDILGIDAPERM